MMFAGNKGELMILLAETCGNCKATSCPLRANDPKAVILLKTRDLKRRFLLAKAVNILKKSQLAKTMEMQILGDKLFCRAGEGVAETLLLLGTLRGIMAKGFQGDINDSQRGSGNYRLNVGSCLHLVQELL